MNLEQAFEGSMTRQRKLQDMAKTRVDCAEDFAKYMDRMPEIKMTPDKVDVDDLIRSATDFSFTTSSKERMELEFWRLPSILGNPIPPSMQEVRMEEFAAVDIHWKMLTDFRPINRKEEEYFQRLVDLGKFRKDTRAQEARQLAITLSSMPGSSGQAKALALGFVTSKSKRGTNETRVKTCRECGLELCTGALCRLGHYEYHTRLILDQDELEAEEKGFSLKSVIAAANAAPDKKAEEAKIKARRAALKGPSLKAMLTAAKPRPRKKRKKKKAKKVVEWVDD